MLGLMQDWPLLCHRIIDHAATYHAGRPVVSRSVEGPIHATNFAAIRARALKVAQRLERDGIGLGDRVATLAWNTWRHLETWYGILGIGAVYHTVNPRLFPDQIAWIVNHAEDRVMIADLTFVPLLEKLADRLPSIERYVVLTDATHMPDTPLRNAVAYEEWIGAVDGDFAWRAFDENTAAGMCYTSGTTGNPKGVLYSHRSNVLHALAASTPDMVGLLARDVVMPVVPMFHANGWSLAFSAPLAGATMVMPGARMDGASIYELLNEFKVTCTAAVPTVWLMLLDHLEKTGGKLPYLKRVVIGGSACPRAMIQKFQDIYGVEVIHAWGMTEMSPLGTSGTLTPEYAGLSGEAKLDVQIKQGHPPFSVEMKITDDAGRELPWDGKTFGRLKVRGPAVARSYFKGEGGEHSRRRRLFRYRRRLDHRSLRLHADHRPRQGRHQVRRRVDFFHRTGKSRGRASESCRSRRHRDQTSEMGRASAAGYRAEKRSIGDQGGDSRLHARQDREMVDAGRRGFRRGNSAHRDRQDPENRAARAIQGLRSVRRGRGGISLAYPARW